MFRSIFTTIFRELSNGIKHCSWAPWRWS